MTTLSRTGLLALIAISCLATGCLWATKTSQVSTRVAGRATLDTEGHLTGGAVHGSASLAGLFIGAELGAGDLQLGPLDADTTPPPPADYKGVHADLFLRASLPGVLPSDHKLERYFDFGAEAGIGGGAVLWDDHVGAQGRGYVGAWVEIGTASVGDHYVALVGDIRSIEYEDNWADDIVVGVGLAWTSRSTATAEDLTWRD